MAVIGNRKKQGSLLKRCAILLFSVLFVPMALSQTPAAEGPAHETFASPEEAVKAMVEALKANDTKALAGIFGPGSEDVISSGDPVADKAEHERFINSYEQRNRLVEEGAEKMVLYVGDDDWPFPVPIVKEAGAWRFDAHEGREELLARRIGRNELSVIQVCLAIVDAQREYALKDREGDGLLEYAQKFLSDPGKKNGLYWKAKEGDEQSPLGALVAYPAKYASSGIMTFIVNHDGVVYQKDLGEGTEKAAQSMKLFNPDNTWQKVEEKHLQAKE